ncbi:hypothetical protein C8J57DRAFT_1247604 [Mycena rebaudengoi]|nr:hypothetical protein C8J57DRAFT_1247604 [Mycena rebaudengoi]
MSHHIFNESDLLDLVAKLRTVADEWVPCWWVSLDVLDLNLDPNGNPLAFCFGYVIGEAFIVDTGNLLNLKVSTKTRSRIAKLSSLLTNKGRTCRPLRSLSVRGIYHICHGPTVYIRVSHSLHESAVGAMIIADLQLHPVLASHARHAYVRKHGHSEVQPKLPQDVERVVFELAARLWPTLVPGFRLVAVTACSLQNGHMVWQSSASVFAYAALVEFCARLCSQIPHLFLGVHRLCITIDDVISVSVIPLLSASTSVVDLLLHSQSTIALPVACLSNITHLSTDYATVLAIPTPRAFLPSLTHLCMYGVITARTQSLGEYVWVSTCSLLGMLTSVAHAALQVPQPFDSMQQALTAIPHLPCIVLWIPSRWSIGAAWTRTAREVIDNRLVWFEDESFRTYAERWLQIPSYWDRADNIIAERMNIREMGDRKIRTDVTGDRKLR